MAETTIVYSDLNDQTPTDTPLVYNHKSIKQNIERLFDIIKGTVPFERRLGARLRSLLFRLMNAETELAIFTELIQVIEEWEPRVEIDYSISSVISNKDQHTYDVIIAYKLKNLDEIFYVEGSFLQETK